MYYAPFFLGSSNKLKIKSILIVLSCSFHSKGNYLNAISTFAATLLPMAFMLASDIVSWTSWWRNKSGRQKPKWTFYFHLPLRKFGNFPSCDGCLVSISM